MNSSSRVDWNKCGLPLDERNTFLQRRRDTVIFCHFTSLKFGAGARCRYRHILDKIGPKVSKMCPKYVQTSLCAQNMPKMWPNIKIEPKLCSNTWYFFGHLYQGIWIMPKLQQNAQNLPFTCPNFSYILVTFWGASAKYRKVLKDHQLGQILDKDEFVLCLLRTGF